MFFFSLISIHIYFLSLFPLPLLSSFSLIYFFPFLFSTVIFYNIFYLVFLFLIFFSRTTFPFHILFLFFSSFLSYPSNFPQHFHSSVIILSLAQRFCHLFPPSLHHFLITFLFLTPVHSHPSKYLFFPPFLPDTIFPCLSFCTFYQLIFSAVLFFFIPASPNIAGSFYLPLVSPLHSPIYSVLSFFIFILSYF